MFANPAFGHKGWLALGPKETTFGTFMAPAVKYPVESWKVDPVANMIADPALWGQVSRRGFYQGPWKVKGTIRLRFGFEQFEEVLRAALGSYSYAALTAPVGDHTYKVGATLDPHSGELSLGDVPTGKVMRLLGAKWVGTTIKVDASETDPYAHLELTVLAMDYDSNGTTGYTPTAPTVSSPATVGSLTLSASGVLSRGSGDFGADGWAVGMFVNQAGNANIPAGTVIQAATDATHRQLSCGAACVAGSGITAGASSLLFAPDLPVMFHVGQTFTDGIIVSPNAAVRALEVSLDNPHLERLLIGSRFMAEPLRRDFVKPVWKMTVEFSAADYLNAYKVGQVISPQFIFQHPTTLASTYKREFEVRSRSAVLTDISVPMEEFGALAATLTAEGYYDSVDASPLVMRLRNGVPQLT